MQETNILSNRLYNYCTAWWWADKNQNM